MDQSIFTDKIKAPGDADLKKALGSCYSLWKEIAGFVFEHCPHAFDEWNYSKFGWNYRIKDAKRAIIYFMPCNKYFKASLVLGKKAAADAQNSDLSADVKEIIANAKIYAEGVGIRIDVREKAMLKNILLLIQIKLRY